MATVIWKELPSKATNGGAPCFYEGGPSETEPTPLYQMPCALPPFVFGAEQQGTALTPAGPGEFMTFIAMVWLLSPGPWGQGGYVNTAGVVNRAHLQQLWLDF